MNSYFLIVRGPAGVGKSTISKLVSEKINAKVYHYDRIMKGFGYNYIPGEKWVPLHKFISADKKMIPKFVNLLEKESNLILEGNFYHVEQINNLVSKINFLSVVVTLKGSLETCIKRNKDRGEKMAREVIEEVYSIMPEFKEGIHIDTDDKDVEKIVDEIMNHLDKSIISPTCK